MHNKKRYLIDQSKVYCEVNQCKLSYPHVSYDVTIVVVAWHLIMSLCHLYMPSHVTHHAIYILL